MSMMSVHDREPIANCRKAHIYKHREQWWACICGAEKPIRGPFDDFVQALDHAVLYQTAVTVLAVIKTGALK